MTFTVAVERKSPDEQFTADDIELFHEECGGGKISRSSIGQAGYASSPASWALQCNRCHTTEYLPVSEAGTALLMKTAVDGKSRKMKGCYGDSDICAVPRT
jgi:hypothetical protein